jgi:hypothetical protein
LKVNAAAAAAQRCGFSTGKGCMTVDEFVSLVDDKQPPAPAKELAAFERSIGTLIQQHEGSSL